MPVDSLPRAPTPSMATRPTEEPLVLVLEDAARDIRALQSGLFAMPSPDASPSPDAEVQPPPQPSLPPPSKPPLVPFPTPPPPSSPPLASPSLTPPSLPQASSPSAFSGQSPAPLPPPSASPVQNTALEQQDGLLGFIDLADNWTLFAGVFLGAACLGLLGLLFACRLKRGSPRRARTVSVGSEMAITRKSGSTFDNPWELNDAAKAAVGTVTPLPSLG